MDIRTFRYLACGGSNVVIDTLIYFVSYNFILLRQAHTVMGIPFQAHILAFAMSFSVSFPIGFVLSKYIVFPES
jgi:putative flippase GtrA